jgi:flagellar biosynthetic protein FlhB
MADDSDDKTEDPTQKHLDEALQRGDVVKSQEVNTWFMIAGAALVLSSFSGSIGSISVPLRNLIANSWKVQVDGPGLLQLAQRLEYMLIGALGVPFLLLVIAAIAGNMLQHRLVWSADPIIPKFSKISPASGAKRVFGKQALLNFVKGLFKLVVVGTVMSVILWKDRFRLESMLQFDPQTMLKIREVATAHDIPIVENVPLARALHASVEIDDEIPVEHYHAVAEVIGYVMGLKRGFSGRPL